MAKKRPSSKAGPKHRGPPPERLKIEGNWEEAVRSALKAKPGRPATKPKRKP